MPCKRGVNSQIGLFGGGSIFGVLDLLHRLFYNKMMQEKREQEQSIQNDKLSF